MDKKIDKTKENIRVDKLDEGERKQLFNRFVDKGGEVIEEKSKRRHLTIDRRKQKQILSRMHPQAEQRLRKEAARSEVKRPAVVRAARENDGVLGGAFKRVKLRIQLRFLGVTMLGGYYFHKRFFKKFNNSYKPALMEIQIMFLEIFMKNPAVGRNITEKLDAIKPLYFELIEMTGNLFDKILNDQILEQYTNFPEVPKKVSELKTQLMQLYRRVYVLKSFENTIMNAFELAIDYYIRAGDDVSGSSSSLKRRMRNILFVIFHKLFPRLHLLFCLYERQVYDPYDPSVAEVLGVADDEKPGRRIITKYMDEAVVKAGNEQEEGREEDAVVADPREKAIRQGLEMMSGLDVAKLRKQYDTERHFEHVSDADKVFITYLLFNEFDREYSFILTTNKIRFRTDFVNRTKIDFRTRLNDLYDRMRKSQDSLREYAEELINYEKARREKPSGSVQYIEFTKRMEVLEKKRTSTGKTAMGVVRDYLNEIAAELQVLMEDMNGAQVFVDNPQEVLVFDPLIEGEKKISGKKIYEAIYTVYCYVTAFSYRLSLTGDLSGGLEFKKDELDRMHQQVQEKGKEQASDAEKADGKSVLEELDDMI